jgi:hypothetical protein
MAVWNSLQVTAFILTTQFFYFEAGMAAAAKRPQRPSAKKIPVPNWSSNWSKRLFYWLTF